MADAGYFLSCVLSAVLAVVSGKCAGFPGWNRYCNSIRGCSISGIMTSKSINRILACAVALLALFSIEAGALGQSRRHGDGSRYERRDRHRRRARYIVAGNKVYYDRVEIEGASASTFSILEDGYAKDGWDVYFRGEKIEGASVGSFNVLGHGYAKDGWTVYYSGKPVEGASVNSFKVLRDGYAKDDWNAWYRGRKMDDVSAGSFEALGDGYAKDAWNAYFRGKKM